MFTLKKNEVIMACWPRPHSNGITHYVEVLVKDAKGVLRIEGCQPGELSVEACMVLKYAVMPSDELLRWVIADELETRSKKQEAEKESSMKTARELVEAWDRGETITTLEMGGLGPGYEQAIQIAAVEFTRANLDVGLTEEMPTSEQQEEQIRTACNRVCDENETIRSISGVMFSAAQWLTYRWLRFGPERLIEEAKNRGQEDRIILCSRNFPGGKA